MSSIKIRDFDNVIGPINLTDWLTLRLIRQLKREIPGSPSEDIEGEIYKEIMKGYIKKCA